MKRIVTILFVLVMSNAVCGQNVGTTCVDDSSSTANLKVVLGFSAGATLFSPANEGSPYYSKYGFGLQIPLVAQWEIASNWMLMAGLRYDFNWEPLYYAIEPVRNARGEFVGGVRFNQTATTATQKGYAFRSYVGIPVELKWYPWSKHKNRLGVALDVYAGYAVNQFIDIENITPSTEGMQYSGYNRSQYNAMKPWKAEVGFTLSTDIIGMAHGVRLFTNLLPSYQDPVSGEKIYLSGITLFL